MLMGTAVAACCEGPTAAVFHLSCSVSTDSRYFSKNSNRYVGSQPLVGSRHATIFAEECGKARLFPTCRSSSSSFHSSLRRATSTGPPRLWGRCQNTGTVKTLIQVLAGAGAVPTAENDDGLLASRAVDTSQNANGVRLGADNARDLAELGSNGIGSSYISSGPLNEEDNDATASLRQILEKVEKTWGSEEATGTGASIDSTVESPVTSPTEGTQTSPADEEPERSQRRPRAGSNSTVFRPGKQSYTPADGKPRPKLALRLREDIEREEAAIRDAIVEKDKSMEEEDMEEPDSEVSPERARRVVRLERPPATLQRPPVPGRPRGPAVPAPVENRLGVWRPGMPSKPKVNADGEEEEAPREKLKLVFKEELAERVTEERERGEGGRARGGASVQERRPLRQSAKPAVATPAERPGDKTAKKPGDSKWKKDKEDDKPWRRGGAGGKTNDSDEDELGSGAGSKKGNRRSYKAGKKLQREQAAREAAPVRQEILEVGQEGLSVAELSNLLALTPADVIKTLFLKSIVSTVNQTLDLETVKLVCEEYQVEVIEAGSRSVEEMAKKSYEFLDDHDMKHLQSRPPVVTIMGHVDHGKTSLLDYIRKAKVAAGEAGGITQGIGAYRVPVKVAEEEQTCVFLDTPGHEAFSAMRARGARVTDIAIIVVAADDGVRPQTLEAIAHAKAAAVPIVIALNKVDKQGVQLERVQQELSTAGLMPEEWGGTTPMVKVSALTGEGVDNLLETVMLVAELEELRANPSTSAKGTVIEASLDKFRGAKATLLVQNGSLRKGDVVLCGEAFGKVRALLADTGAQVEMAGPSSAVEVLGLSAVPAAGDTFEVLGSLDEARERAEELAKSLREQRLAAQGQESKISLASLASSVASSAGIQQHELNLILKVDVQGSAEAVREALAQLPQDTVNLRFLMASAGDVSASDVELATASGAVVLAFNVGMATGVEMQAEAAGVEVRPYRVIYDLVDDMRKAMEGMLELVEEREILGTAEVRGVFPAGSGKVAGCMVSEGKLTRGCGISVTRKGNATPVYEGSIASLRRIKEAAKEVVAGLECGVGAADFDEWQEGDIINAYILSRRAPTLEEASSKVASALEKAGAAVSTLSQAVPSPSTPQPVSSRRRN